MESYAKYIRVAIVTVVVVGTVLILQYYPFHEKQAVYLVNDGLTDTRGFSIASVKTPLNTSAKGTIFVWGDQGIAERMQIVASFEIDPDDFGGMAIYIPKKWSIANIVSSYPENRNPSIYAGTQYGSVDLGGEWKDYVEVGRVYSGQQTGGGGTGTIVIDLVSDQKAILPSETYNIMVTIGSKTNPKTGVRSVGIDEIRIPVSVDL